MMGSVERSEDFIVPIPPRLDSQISMPIDEACKIVCAKLNLPVLGGPSGMGWSYIGTAQKCPHLFRQTYERGDGSELRHPAIPLQIGGLYHTLQALHYGYGLGGDVVYHVDRGLLVPELAPKTKRGKRKRSDGQMISLPLDGADQLLSELKSMADPLRGLEPGVSGATTLPPAPSMSVILEAERLFDAHTEFYGNGEEDVEPLAVEWVVRHPTLGYTCRYDMIGRLGAHDRTGLPGSVVCYERKTSAWKSEMAMEGWFLDGEILGEIMCWKPSGCEQLFGPLTALVVDIVTKAKVPECVRIIIHPDSVPVRAHERWIRYTQSQIALWRATGVYPQNWVQCWDRFGRCGEYDRCSGRAGNMEDRPGSMVEGHGGRDMRT